MSNLQKETQTYSVDADSKEEEKPSLGNKVIDRRTAIKVLAGGVVAVFLKPSTLEALAAVETPVEPAVEPQGGHKPSKTPTEEQEPTATKTKKQPTATKTKKHPTATETKELPTDTPKPSVTVTETQELTNTPDNTLTPEASLTPSQENSPTPDNSLTPRC